MRTLVKLSIALLLLIGVAGGAYLRVASWWRERNRPSWREEAVVRGDIKFVVNSTGTVKPVMSVQVGAFVSGPIDPNTPLVEFNQEVKQGDVLAVIDQRIYKADVARDEAAVAAALASTEAAAATVEAAEAGKVAAAATLNTRLAEVEQVRAQLLRAEADHRRATDLAQQNPDFISQAEMDQFKYGRLQLSEQLNVAQAAVEQARAAILQADAAVSEAKASLSRAEATVAQAQASKTRSELNRDYTVITSPVDGIVIDRKIEPGQTLAAAFQTPELFVVAPRMREEMHVYASVDEADIGLIRRAQELGNVVEFTVDAYPDVLFQGAIKEVRFSSTTTQNVVTYPVIVSAANPDLKLLPGMTASLSFHVETKTDVLKIPNAALRFFPPEQHVREEDKKVLDGAATEEDNSSALLSAAEKSVEARQRNQRHVWVAEGSKLRAVEVTIGISDSQYTELVSGELNDGLKLVTGLKKKED